MSNTRAHAYDALGLFRSAEALAHQALEVVARHNMVVCYACELGCATGAGALRLAETGARVLAMEQNAALLDVAQSKASFAAAPVVWVHGELHRSSDASVFVGRCDLVVSNEGLGQAADAAALQRFLADVTELLRPGGLFVGGVATELPDEPFDRMLRDDTNYLAFERSDAAQGQGSIRRRVVWFTREIELWWRDEHEWVEHVWPQQELISALGAAGLELVEWRRADVLHQRDRLIAQRVRSIHNSTFQV